MSPAASFRIDSINLDYSELLARDDTTLIKRESIFLLHFCFGSQELVDFVRRCDDAISFILNRLFFLLREALVVRDI